MRNGVITYLLSQVDITSITIGKIYWDFTGFQQKSLAPLSGYFYYANFKSEFPANRLDNGL